MTRRRSKVGSLLVCGATGTVFSLSRNDSDTANVDPHLHFGKYGRTAVPERACEVVVPDRAIHHRAGSHLRHAAPVPALEAAGRSRIAVCRDLTGSPCSRHFWKRTAYRGFHVGIGQAAIDVLCRTRG